VTGILTISLAVMLIFGGCSEDKGDIKAAYDLYMAAATAMNEANGVSLDMDTSIGMGGDSEDEDEGFSFSMQGSVKAVKKSDTEFEMEMRQTADMFGAETETITYFKDGYMYMELAGERMKMALPLEDALTQANTSAVIFEQDAIKKCTSQKVDNGTELTLTVSGDALKKYMEETSQDALAGFGAGVSMELGDAIITAVIDNDGKMFSLSMLMAYDIAASEDENATMAIKISMYNIVTGDLTIDFPAELADYPDVAA
jgi:hypothetical protein